jgi:vancomycin permeability regulator SanA
MTSAATELAARTKQNETDIEVLTALRLNASSALTEAIDDRVAALLVAGANVTLTYNDPANTLTIAASGGGGGGSGNSYFPGGWG